MCVSCKLIMQPYEDITDCTKIGKLETVDISTLKIEAVNDTYFYIMGKTYLKPLKKVFIVI